MNTELENFLKEDKLYKTFYTMVRKGISKKVIMEELNISRSKFYTLFKKLTELGADIHLDKARKLENMEKAKKIDLSLEMTEEQRWLLDTIRISLEQGVNLADIAREENVSRQHVNKVFNDHVKKQSQ